MSPTSKRSSTKTAAAAKTKKKASKSSKATGPIAGMFAKVAVGHTEGASRLNPQDADLFQAFQANLLSLISHELKTPLTGILNSLLLLSEEEQTGNPVGMPRKELLEMAYRNAQRLNHTLSSLLDLAALESGTFHVKLREVELQRLTKGVVNVQDVVARLRGMALQFRNHVDLEIPTLADPHKLGRALALTLEIAMSRAADGAQIAVEATRSKLRVKFPLKAGSEEDWEDIWKQSLVGHEGRTGSSLAVFAGAMQREEAFLARSNEGLGSEFLLVHEILRLHQAKFSQSVEGGVVTLEMQFSDLNSLQSLKTVLAARSEQIATGIGSIALALLSVPKGLNVETFRNQVKAKLFRTTDAVYPLLDERQVALVMDDCSPLDAGRLVNRIQTSLGHVLQHGIAVYPQEVSDADLLIRIATERLKG